MPYKHFKRTTIKITFMYNAQHLFCESCCCRKLIACFDTLRIQFFKGRYFCFLLLCHSHLCSDQLVYISALSKLRESAEISAVRYTNLLYSICLSFKLNGSLNIYSRSIPLYIPLSFVCIMLFNPI